MANMAGLNRTIEDTDTDPMADESVELTEGQKACLRLVDDHLTSKEIGRSLGISHFTVDQRLDAARRKLNAATRKDAAKIFAALEQRTISEPFVYETQDLEQQQYTASQ
jgi:DNA-binding CsgD family transcriptional regulator